MARTGLPYLLCALFLTLASGLANARPEESQETRINKLLRVKSILLRGREYLKTGQFQSAVNVLEGGLASVDNDKYYLQTLRDAYRALIEDLRQQNRVDEMPVYQQKLESLVGKLTTDSAPTAAMPPPPTTQGPVTPVVQAVVPATRTAVPPPAGIPQVTTPPTAVTVVPPPAGQPQATGTRTTVRGVPADEPLDPFSEANSKQTELARKYLLKAEQEFTANRFLVADGLYEKAFRADEKSLGEARVRWAYCRLVDVREALNRSTPPPASDLERQVRQAMSLAPEADQLKKFGEDLLVGIQKRGNQAPGTTGIDPATIPLRQTPRVQGSSWAIVDTPNFRVYHNLDPEEAAKAARAAETARCNGYRKWFGDDGGPWSPRCELYLHATGQAYTAATGMAAECPGHSSVGQAGERVDSRRIDIHVDAANWMIGVLPHETTHVVIAGRFGPHPVPRWADEGMAVLAEPRDLVQRHLANLPQHRKEEQLFTLKELLNMDNYPKPRQVGAFYAQSVSLVDYLSRQPGGPQKFSLFLKDGLRSGYDASLKQHYGLNSLQELEGYWTRFAFQQVAGQAATSGYAP